MAKATADAEAEQMQQVLRLVQAATEAAVAYASLTSVQLAGLASVSRPLAERVAAMCRQIPGAGQGELF